MTQTSKRRPVELSATFDARFFRALCDPNRLALLAWLVSRHQAETVSAIAASGACPVDLSVVSRHLAILREAGIVSATRQGRQVLYQARAVDLARTLRALADALEGCCGRPTEAAQ